MKQAQSEVNLHLAAAVLQPCLFDIDRPDYFVAGAAPVVEPLAQAKWDNSLSVTSTCFHGK